MPEIVITIHGRAVHDMIDRAPQRIERGMEAAREDTISYLLAIVRRYPPPRQGSTYVRTNTLMRSWTRVVQGNRFGVGSSGNMAPYNRQVMDRDHQARVHRGRWDTVQAISERSQPTIQRFFDNRIQAALR